MHHPRGRLDLGRLMRRGNKASLKLGRSEIHARVQTVIKEKNEFREIAVPRAGEINHRPGGEEEAEHRADAVKDRGRPCLA